MTRTQPVRVTVAIPTHNRPEWLARSLDSAIAQDVEGLEILVCDDGGLEATAVVVATRAVDARVRLLRGEALGIAANHRRALAAARGEFIVFLSDDDGLEAGFVARRLDLFARDATAVVAFSGYKACDADLRPVRTFAPTLPTDRALEGEELVRAALAREWSINGSMYRRSALLSAWPDEAIVGSAFDFALHLRVALAPGARGWYGTWCDVLYRLHEGQTSRGDAVLRQFRAGAATYEYILGHELPTRARGWIARDGANWHVRWGRALASAGDMAGTRAHMRKAVRMSPTMPVAWRQLALAYLLPSRLCR